MNTVVVDACYTIYYIYKYTILVTRNFTKSDEFCGNSMWILCRFHKASVQLTVELQYYIHRQCLPFPWNDTVREFVLTKSTSSYFVERLYILYTNMAYKLHTGSK